jgi:aspartate oxidase
MKKDFLVIGSGKAGVSFAIKEAKCFPFMNTSVLCKSKPKKTNTTLVRDGIVAALNNNLYFPAKHLENTVKATDRFCVLKEVEYVMPDTVLLIQNACTKRKKNDGVFFYSDNKNAWLGFSSLAQQMDNNFKIA